MNSKCCNYKLINKYLYKFRNIDNYFYNIKFSLIKDFYFRKKINNVNIDIFILYW